MFELTCFVLIVAGIVFSLIGGEGFMTFGTVWYILALMVGLFSTIGGLTLLFTYPFGI